MSTRRKLNRGRIQEAKIHVRCQRKNKTKRGKGKHMSFCRKGVQAKKNESTRNRRKAMTAEQKSRQDRIEKGTTSHDLTIP